MVFFGFSCELVAGVRLLSGVFAEVIPRLRELLANYEGVELSEMLVSMAQSVDSDMDILMTLVPEVEKRYNEVWCDKINLWQPMGP